MVKKISFIFLFINIVLYFAAAAIFLVAPEFILFKWSLLGVNIFLTLIGIIYWRKEIKQGFNRNIFYKASENLINIFLISAILGILNYLVYKNNLYLDLTKHKLNSLSSQSVKAIENFKEPLTIQLFSTKQSRQRFLNLLNLYKQKSHLVSLDFIDIEENLAVVELNNVQENGTIIINYRNKSYKTVAKDELAVTNLLLRIINPQKKVIYYVVGHNEMSLDSKSPIGGDFLREKILSNNYELKSLQLQYGVPADAGLVLILNPQIEFLESEITHLKNYTSQGGSILITLAPAFNGLVIKNLEDFLIESGVKFQNLLILDKLAAQQGAQASIPIVNSYGPHKITKEINDRTLFPVSGHYEILEKGKFKWRALARSIPFPGSWGETNFQEVKDGKASFNENIDFQGPLNLFLVGENQKARMAIFSSSSFVSNQFQGQSNNFNLFLNSIGWLVREEVLLSLDRPNLKGNLIYISEQQMNIIFYFSVLSFPFLFFGLAIFFYHRRVNA